jgi:hypothetical protein
MTSVLRTTLIARHLAGEGKEFDVRGQTITGSIEGLQRFAAEVLPLV